MVKKLFPTIIVDDFLENPDYIRQRGLNLEFHQTDGTWPGKRTQTLNECDPELFDYLSKKFFTVHYDFLNRIDWSLQINFQLIEKFSEDKNSTLNRGWIHTDHNRLLAGVLYLTPDADPDTGTSIFKPKTLEHEKLLKDETQAERIDFYLNDVKIYTSNKQDGKEDLYLNKPKIDVDNYTKTLNKFNSNFNETLNVKNIYNRLITFDCNEWHAANNFHNGTEPRLTVVFFVDSVNSCSQPALERLRNIKLDIN